MRAKGLVLNAAFDAPVGWEEEGTEARRGRRREWVTQEQMMFLSNITNRGATPALINTLAFTEARHKMIAENVANWQTPNYKTKQVDTQAFQKALRSALDEKGGDPHKPFVLKGTREFGTDKYGLLRFTPSEEPVGNVLFHDGTNGSIERMMSDLADNAMVHEAANTILKGYFEGVRKAIRGRL